MNSTIESLELRLGVDIKCLMVVRNRQRPLCCAKQRIVGLFLLKLAYICHGWRIRGLHQRGCVFVLGIALPSTNHVHDHSRKRKHDVYQQKHDTELLR